LNIQNSPVALEEDATYSLKEDSGLRVKVVPRKYTNNMQAHAEIKQTE